MFCQLECGVLVAVLLGTAAYGEELNESATKTSTIGVARMRYQQPIVGGTDATIEDFPHQVAWLSYGLFVCAGSILSPEWIISAGHCFLEGNETFADNVFRVGSNVSITGGTEHRPVSFHQHPQYSPHTLDFDVGLVKVEPPIEFNECTQPISMMDNSSLINDNDIVIVTGWGKTREDGDSYIYGGSYMLQRVNLHTVNHDECAKVYTMIPISERMFCAMAPHKDACQGDSGGPITVQGKDNSWRLLGLVSWGVGCARPGLPGVYTDLRDPTIRQYIRDVTGLNL